MMSLFGEKLKDSEGLGDPISTHEIAYLFKIVNENHAKSTQTSIT